jgi:hypothetical protein
MLAGCGCGAKPCTTCPDIGGNWSLTATNVTASQNCPWIASTGTTSMAVDQTPLLGSKAAISLYGYQFPCTIYETGSVVGSTTTRSQYGTWSETRVDSLAIILSGSTAFTGTWSITSTRRDSYNPSYDSTCTASVRVSGQKL